MRIIFFLPVRFCSSLVSDNNASIVLLIPIQTPLHSSTELNWLTYSKSTALESVWFGRLGLERKQHLIRQVLSHYVTLGRQLIHTAFSSCAEPSVWITVILFLCTALVIGWKLSGLTGHAWSTKASLTNDHKKRFSHLPLCLRIIRNETVWASFISANHFLRNTSPAYESFLWQVEFTGRTPV